MLRPIGRIAFADAQGRLPRLGRPPSGPLGALARRLSDRIAADLGPDLVSVALRGSVARGTDVPGASDLDLVVVRRASDEEPALPPCEVEVEVSAMTLDALLHERPFAWMRFALAHSGWTIAGRDVVAELPEPTLGPHCVAHLKSVERWSAAWPGYLVGDADEAERRLTCRWLMKRIVRSAFETVMLEIGGYTRDIHPCAEAAAARHPERADRIWRAAELAVAPTGDPAVIAAVAEPLVAWLHERRSAVLGAPPP